MTYVGGCATTHPTPDSTAVTGCRNRGASRGSLGEGSASLRWERRFRAHSSASAESGSVTFASSAGRVVFRYEGAGTLRGATASGRWSVTSATGVHASLAGRTGTYASTLKRRGAEIVLDLTG